MKKWMIGGIVVAVVVVLLIVFNVGVLGTSGIERSLSKNVAPGENFVVDLKVNLVNDERYFLIEENIPEGFIVDDRNANGNVIKIAQIQNAESVVYSYNVKAPEEAGEYTFIGEYGMEGIDGIVPIEGPTLIVVG